MQCWFLSHSLNATFEGYAPWTVDVHTYAMEDFIQVLVDSAVNSFSSQYLGKHGVKVMCEYERLRYADTSLLTDQEWGQAEVPSVDVDGCH